MMGSSTGLKPLKKTNKKCNISVQGYKLNKHEKPKFIHINLLSCLLDMSLHTCKNVLNHYRED